MNTFLIRLETVSPAHNELGQTMAEYAIVIAVITLTIVGALSMLSGNVQAAIERIAGYVT
jgi:Flp pilus assembly pilin Flp